jgi:hypothetical protein
MSTAGPLLDKYDLEGEMTQSGRRSYMTQYPVERMQQAVRKYIQACNDGDAAAIASHFLPDAVAPSWNVSATQPVPE